MHVWVELAYSQFIAYTLLTPSSLMSWLPSPNSGQTFCDFSPIKFYLL